MWNTCLVNGVVIENQYKINIEMASKTVVALSDTVLQWHGLGAAQAWTHTPHTTIVHDTNSKVLSEASKNIRGIN